MLLNGSWALKAYQYEYEYEYEYEYAYAYKYAGEADHNIVQTIMNNGHTLLK